MLASLADRPLLTAAAPLPAPLPSLQLNIALTNGNSRLRSQEDE